jgi:esterase/lipase superfamily enzyme
LIRIINKTPEVNAIHILAHSMGSRIVVDGLSTLEAVDHGLKIGHVLFAAPDIYSSIFEQGVPAMSALSRRVTLYASDKDRALHCSVLFNSNPRAGLGGSNILLHRDIDTIDMSEAEELPLVSVPCSAGHSYFWSNSAALGDIHELITYDAEPENRHRLERRSRGNQHFWILLRESL